MIKTLIICLVASVCWLPTLFKTNHRDFIADGPAKSSIDTVGLKTGDKFPDIAFKDASGKEAKIEQFRGRYIYIDVWASWCYPCRKEYPKLAELKNRMKDKAIEFIGISCDTREDRWKGAMRDNKIDGVQWILKDTEFMRAFKVAMVPRYILIDRKGKVLNPNMERPSSRQIDSLLNSLKHI